jgi:two-component system chemotaxis response regulator CheY
MTVKRVLIIDDSLFMRTIIKDTLEREGFSIVGQASTGEQGVRLAFELQPDYVTLDIVLPDMIGTDILKVFKDEGLQSKVMLISAVGQDSVINEGLKLGALAYIQKPFTPEQLIAMLNKEI